MGTVTRLYHHKVYLSPLVMDDLATLPPAIIDKIQFWTEMVEHIGLKKTRRAKAFDDRALGGQRSGLRTIRLSRRYQAVYTEKHLARLELCEIQKVESDDS